MRRNWLYKKLASTKTSVWLLGILCAFFLVGTIFPQGKGYAEEGGILLRVLKFVDVLNIFTAPLFLIAAALLFANQALCQYERLRLLLSRTSASMSEDGFREDPRTLSISLAPVADMSEEAISKGMAGLGFKVRRGRPLGAGGTCALEMGFDPRWSSWIFHTAILVLLAGIAISYFFAFEGELSLLPGQSEEVSTRSAKARWYRLRGKGVEQTAGKSFKVGLDDFITEYTESPTLQYPSRGLGRLSLFSDLKGEQVSYSLPGDSLFPKEWMSLLVIYDGGTEAKRKTIQVNAPLRYSGVTFYQMDIQQKMLIGINGDRTTMEVQPGILFKVPDIRGELRADTLRVGTLYKKVGGTEPIIPYADLELVSKGEGGKEVARKIGKLTQGEPLVVQGVTLSLLRWQESSVLSYRYDPGRPLLWVAALTLLATMAFRIWVPWYRLEYLITGAGDRRRLYLRITQRGLLANSDRMMHRVVSTAS